MKKIFAVALVAMMAMTANAQIYVGGGIGFQTTSQDGNSDTFFKIMPEIGYNLNEDWAVGVAVGYGESKTTTKVNGVKLSDKVKAFEIAPYARYTFAKIDMVNLFIDGTVGYQHTDNAGLKNNTFGLGLKPGIAVNLNDKLSFVAHVGFFGYENSKDDYDGAEAVNTFGVNLDGSNLSFGVYYNF